MKALLLLLVLLLSAPTFAKTYVDSVLVIKSARQLYLIKNNEIVKNYSISLGFSPQGHKVQEGDGKTPEGQYKITWKQEQSRFHLALHINYPNSKDRARARQLGVSPGGDIKIHGLSDDWAWVGWPSKFIDWTDGCIAVTNNEIEELWSLIRPGTPIEIRP